MGAKCLQRNVRRMYIPRGARSWGQWLMSYCTLYGNGAKQKDLCDMQGDICTLLMVFENLFTEVEFLAQLYSC